MAAVDPAELRRILVDFAQAHCETAPLDLVEQLRATVVCLDEWGVPLAPAKQVAAPPPAPAATVREAGPRRVQLGIERDIGGDTTVVARTPAAEPVARTLRTILDLLAQKPLRAMSSAILELAAWAEAMELENADLRRQLEELQA